MKRLWTRLAAWWVDLLPHQRRTVNALALCVVGYLAHFAVFTVAQPFYIEDAGITFAYARHLAEGYGLVPFPGGERVEGYSNPLWTFLIAGFYLLHVPVWISSKLLGALLGAVTLPLAWAITREARGGREDLVNVAPAFLLAASSQFVIWNASGLENSLFCVLLAGGIYRTVREGTRGGWPLSAFLFFLLAITRPDGVAYALVGLVARGAFAVVARRPLALLGWILTFAVPFALYQWWRYTYFAWPYPETYYAKLGTGTKFKPFNWNGRGWTYLRNYMGTYWVAWVSPLFVVAVVGLRRWRWVATLLVVALAATMVVWDGRAPFLDGWDLWAPVRRKWDVVRLSTLYSLAALVGLLALGRPGWRSLAMLWAAFCAGVFFNLYSGGDWMDAFRWANLWSVPQWILLAVGLGELVDRLPGTTWRPVRRLPALRTVLVAAGTLVMALPNAWGSQGFALRPETGVRDVKRRVDYMTRVQHRLGIDHVTLLDVDQGAHLWYSGFAMADVAGLVDIRMGHHKYEKDFIREYVFEQLRPDFIHSHGNWQRRTRVNTFPEWKQYWEIPGYPAGKKSFHVGNHVARRHFVTEAYDGPPDRRVDLEGDLALEGWDIPSPVVPVAGKFHLQTWFSTTGREAGFRVLVFVTDGAGHLSVQEVAPGYDWLPPEEWAPEEIALGRYDVALAEDLPPGSYQVGLVVLDSETGAVVPAAEPGVEAPGVLAEAGAPPRYMRGEILLDTVLQVVTRAEATAEAEADLGRVMELAATDQCEAAWTAWKGATRHVVRNTRWHDDHRPTANTAVVRCLVQRAAGVEDDLEKAAILIPARRWRFDEPSLLEAAGAVADRLEAAGAEARASQDWETAFTAYDTAALLDPHRAWARRYAEEARDWRLDLDGVDRKKPKVVRKPKAADRKEGSRSPRVKTAVPREGEAGNPPPRPLAPGGPPIPERLQERLSRIEEPGTVPPEARTPPALPGEQALE